MDKHKIDERVNELIDGKSFNGCSVGPRPATSNLSFAAALNHFNAGEVMRRSSWGCGEVFLVKSAQCTYILRDGRMGGVGLGSFFIFKLPNNTHRSVELSSEDLLAEDWAVVS